MRTSHRSLWVALAALLLAVTAVLPALVQASQTQAEPGISLHLRVGTFDPLVAEPPDVPNGLSAVAPAEGTAYYVIQFEGPIRMEWRGQLEAAGAEVMEYIPDYAYVVRAPGAEVGRLGRLPGARWVGPWQPAYRLHPELLAQVEAQEEGLESTETAQDVRLVTFPGVTLESILISLQELGLEPTAVAQSDWGATLRVRATADTLARLAVLPDVRWIEPYVEPQLLNERTQANWLMATQAVWQGLGLYGQGQVVGVADTGLDTGNVSTLHEDVRGRVQEAFALGRSGDWSDFNGHGTHVAGSVLGNGVRSGSSPAQHGYAGSQAGSAPEARLVMQSVMDSDGKLGGIPVDLKQLFQQSYDAGARIHTNSWGAPVHGEYTVDSQSVDQFGWNHKDMTILFAAGNEGEDKDGNGVVDPDSISSPGTAKNAVTVGASEGQRSTSSNDTWYWYGYNANPIRDDLVSNNHGAMAAFSSRGPTDDRRFKPEVVAPGTNVSSLHSSLAAGSGDYALYSGTSMATPLTAGVTALIRQWYQQTRGLANPSAALIKATLLNGTMRIDPGQYGSSATQEIPSAWPNNVAGWGRVNVKHSIAPASPRNVWYTEHQGLSTGQSVTYRFQHRPAEVPAQAARDSHLGAVQAQAAGSQQPAAATVDVQEASVPPGAIINGRASGFPPNQSATVSLDGISLGTLSGNASGAWSFRIFLSTEMARGSHSVTVVAGSTNAADTFGVVGGKDGTLRATLVWTDYPASLSAGKALVNDLNLTVSGPGGSSRGNGTTDNLNNTEEVWLLSAGAGIYEVTVNAPNVPNGPQPFALVVSGDNLAEVNEPSQLKQVYLPVILKDFGSAAQVWTTITSEDFEGSFPKPGWVTFDDASSGPGEYYFAKRNCRPHAGTYSGWAVGGGAQGSGLACGANYPNNAISILRYGPFSLAGAADAELLFQYWANTELNHDVVFWGASLDGREFYGVGGSGPTTGWASENFDLTNVYTLGDLRGKTQVWVAWVLDSDASTTLPEGFYVDDIVLRKYGSSLTSVPSGQLENTASPCASEDQPSVAGGFLMRCASMDLSAIVGPTP